MFTFQLVDGGKQLVAKENPSKALPHSYTIELKDALEAGKTIKVRKKFSFRLKQLSNIDFATFQLQVEAVFSNHLAPHPAEITQKEKQLVQYRGNAYLYSQYKVKSQTTKILLSSSNIESFTKVKPSSQSESTVTYGPYDNIPPLSEVNSL